MHGFPIRRWLVRGLAGLVLVLVCVRLGLWQLDRNESRSARNDVIETNIDQPAAPVSELVAPGFALDAGDEWRTVELTGRYDTEHELALRLRPVDGERGVHAVTPLVTDDGVGLLVDRGFLPTTGDDTKVDLPAPPSGEVTVQARLRRSESDHGTGIDVGSGLIRYVDVDALAEALPYPLFGAWGELASQDPDDDELQSLPRPEIDSGPHLSYAIQWFLFAVIGVGGFVVLIRTEARSRSEEPVRPSEPVG